MRFQVNILRCAVKSLEKIGNPDYERIKSAIFSLGGNPRPPGCQKLSGREAWRIRIGTYRVIYEILDRHLIVLVVDIGHRKDIYR